MCQDQRFQVSVATKVAVCSVFLFVCLFFEGVSVNLLKIQLISRNGHIRTVFSYLWHPATSGCELPRNVAFKIYFLSVTKINIKMNVIVVLVKQCEFLKNEVIPAVKQCVCIQSTILLQTCTKITSSIVSLVITPGSKFSACTSL